MSDWLLSSLMVQCIPNTVQCFNKCTGKLVGVRCLRPKADSVGGGGGGGGGEGTKYISDVFVLIFCMN